MTVPQFARVEYETVPIDGTKDVDPALHRMAAAGWVLKGTYESMGYTRRLIFERPVAPSATLKP